MNDVELPPAPPLPPEVRERVLDRVLDGMDQPAPSRFPTWAPLLTAVAVVVVMLAAAVAVALPDADPVSPATVAPPPPRPDELPVPTGDPVVDAALARCGTAMLISGHAAEYPPPSAWRAIEAPGSTPLETRLVIDDRFACLASPDSVAFSAVGRPLLLAPPDDDKGGILVTRMAPHLHVVYNPEHRVITIDAEPEIRIDRAGVAFVDLEDDGALYELSNRQVGIDGAAYSFEHSLGATEEPISVVDRTLPHRGDSGDDRELTECLERLPVGTNSRPTLWTPVARHRLGGEFYPAILARIGDVAAGFCVRDPDDGLTFVSGPLPVERDRPLTVVDHHSPASIAVLLTAPPDVTGMVMISSVQGSGGITSSAHSDCTLAGGLALCTAQDVPGFDVGDTVVAITAFTAEHPAGVQVFRR